MKVTSGTYYIRPMKAVVDVHAETLRIVKRERDLPLFMPRIDCIYADPSVTRTHVGCKPGFLRDQELFILCPNAYDLYVLLTAHYQICEMNGRKMTERSVSKLFHGSYSDAVNTMLRAAFKNLPAPGGCAHWRNKQLKSEPEAWSALHERLALESQRRRLQ